MMIDRLFADEEPARGTGLGLSVVSMIVKKMAGSSMCKAMG
jgi:hypothetical protein